MCKNFQLGDIVVKCIKIIWVHLSGLQCWLNSGNFGISCRNIDTENV